MEKFSILRVFQIAALMLPVIFCETSDARIDIIVNPGHFKTVGEAAVAEEQVDWWDGDYEDDRACTECFAATELAGFLPRCTDIGTAEIWLHMPLSLPPDGDVIIVGCSQSNPFVSRYPLTGETGLETPESFRITASSDNNRIITVIEGGDRMGTLYGVYAYLEELGVRFYGLGKTGTEFPPDKKPLPSVLNRIDNPSFLTRGYHAWEDRGNLDFFLWMARNRMNFWTAAEKEYHLCKKLGMKLADGGHVMMMHFLNAHHEYPYNHPSFKGDENKPKDPYKTGTGFRGDVDGDGRLTYFEAHPEWFGLKNGKRSDNTTDEFGDNFCTTNDDAKKELAKNIVQALIDGRYSNVDILNFWLMDGSRRWCECNECAAVGNHTDQLLRVVHAVLEEIGSARRGGRLSRPVELSSLAYLETIVPPSHPLPEGFDYDNFSMTFFPIERCYDHMLADPSCTELNSRLADNYLAWVTGDGRHYKGTMFIGEYYNVSYLKSLPMLYTRIMAADIPWYHRTGTRHFHYMHTPTRLWGTWTLNQFLMARLLWNVETDADNLVAEYFERFYPTTTSITREFYSNLEQAMTGFKAIRYWGWKNTLRDTSKEIFTKRHFGYEITHPLMNDGADILEMKSFTTAARNNIDAAIIACRDQTELNRLREDEYRFSYGEMMMDFHYHLYRTALFHHAGNSESARRELRSLERSAERLRSIVDLVQVSSSHANAENGLEATQAVDVYEFFKKTYGE